MSGLAILVAIATLVIGVLLGGPLLEGLRRKRLARTPFPPQWRDILRQRVPFFRQMPADLQLQLKKQIQIFIAAKRFVGCDGLEVSDEMRVAIAAQACLLILNRPDHHFSTVKEILVYPAPFIVDREAADEFGLVHQNSEVLSGESWAHGQVVLSWPDVLQGAENPADGRNVVIHEFAHQLDQEKGYANGAPGVLSRQRRDGWSQVMNREFRALKRQVRNHEESFLDPYGATDPAEFFAVITETFFEQPHEMAAEHPELYAELRNLYRIEPLVWH